MKFKKSNKPQLWDDVNSASFGLVILIVLFTISMILWG